MTDEEEFAARSQLKWTRDAWSPRSKDNVMAQAIREVAWNAANDLQKCPIKRGSREQKIAAHAFECSVGSRDAWRVLPAKRRLGRCNR